MLKTSMGGAALRPWPSRKKVKAVTHEIQQLLVSPSNAFHFNSVPHTDMHIYGHCPAHDEIYLVVCNHCGQVVKPQAFEAHCERWHGPLTKMCSQSSTVAPQQRPRPGRPPPNLPSPRERQKDGRCQEASASSSATLPVSQRRPTKAHKEAARYCLRVFNIIATQKKMRWIDAELADCFCLEERGTLLLCLKQ